MYSPLDTARVIEFKLVERRKIQYSCSLELTIPLRISTVSLMMFMNNMSIVAMCLSPTVSHSDQGLLSELYEANYLSKDSIRDNLISIAGRGPGAAGYGYN